MKLTEKQYKKDKIKYLFLKRLLSGAIKKLFHFESDSYFLPDDSPYMVIANHSCDLDPLFIGTAFPHMYFVASEHIFSWGILSKIIISLLHPIARRKGAVDALAVLDIRRRMKLGAHICIFPEGNRTPDGITGEIHPTTAKLIKSCRCGIASYRIKGGFFTQPRFSHKLRKGRITGELVALYTPEQVRIMSDEELYGVICRDLYEDAYETQRERRVRFRCKAPSAGIEASLYACPECGEFGKLHSDNTGVSCACGMRAEFDEYGDISGCRFKTFTEWFSWQKNELKAVALDTVFADNNLIIKKADESHKRKKTDLDGIKLDKNAFTLTKNGITAETYPLDRISAFAYYSINNIVFSSGTEYYIIQAKYPFCGVKYTQLYNILKGDDR